MAPAPQGSVGLDLKIRFEAEAWDKGLRRVGGVDEVGRGPLAGPVVAACVVITQDLLREPIPAYLYEVDDSKKLSAAKREELSGLLHNQEGLEMGIGIVDQTVIDRINILEATRLAMHSALEKLSTPPEYLLVDGSGRLPGYALPQMPIVKGDSLSLSIGAASIIAKVVRDRIMQSYDAEFPGYGFAKHKGYGTAEHLESLRKLGPCAIHRRSFAPVGAMA